MHSVNMSITSFASYISLVKRVYQTLLEAWPWDIRKWTKTSRYKPLKQSAIWVYQKSSRAKSVLAVSHDLAFYNSFIDFELKMLLLLYQMKRLISNKWSSIYFSYFKVFSNCILHIVNSTNRFNIAPRHFINRLQNVLCVKTKKKWYWHSTTIWRIMWFITVQNYDNSLFYAMKKHNGLNCDAIYASVLQQFISKYQLEFIYNSVNYRNHYFDIVLDHELTH